MHVDLPGIQGFQQYTPLTLDIDIVRSPQVCRPTKDTGILAIHCSRYRSIYDHTLIHNQYINTSKHDY